MDVSPPRPERSPRQFSLATESWGSTGDAARRSEDRSALGAQAPSRPGRRPDSFYRVAVGSAILNLQDRASLEFNVLAQLSAVRRLADERYAGKVWRRGLCLRDLITEAIDETVEASDGDDLATLRLVVGRAAEGHSLTAIAADLGIRRESLSRGLWARATGLIWERLKPRLLALEG
jgi:hypothetical protein